MVYLYTRHHQGIASQDIPEHTQSQPRQARAHPEDNTETYQSITIAHHETYQSQPEDTSRIPEPAKAGHETHHSQLKQGMRHTRAYQRTL